MSANEWEKKMLRGDKSADEDEIIAMIEEKMNSGVSRLKVDFSEELEEGEKRTAYHHGRCDIGSPWATGKASLCDD